MDFPTFAEVRAKVRGLKGVMQMLGDAPQFDHKWKSLPECPFCGNRDCAGVYEKEGVDHFKCHHTACSSGGRVVTETGYINLREGLSEDTPAEGGPSPAYRRMLDLAGSYVEERRAESGERKERAGEPPALLPNPVWPSAVPATATAPKEREAHAAEPRLGTTPRPAPVPTGGLPNPVLPPEPADDVALIREAIELIRREKNVSINSLRSGLKLGYARALRIMDGLERWGVVGPSVPGEKFRTVLNLPEAGGPPPAQNVGGIEPGSDNPAAATAPASPSSNGPAFMNDGVSGSGSPGSAPLEDGGPVPPELSQQKPPSVPPKAAAPGAGPAGKLDEKPALAPGYAALRWFYDRLFPTSSEMQAYMPDGSAVPSPLPKAVMKKIKFRPVSLDEKRMLPPVACEALGFRAKADWDGAAVKQRDEGRAAQL